MNCSVMLDDRWRVDAQVTVNLPVPKAQVAPHFNPHTLPTADTFHVAVHFAQRQPDGTPIVGSPLTIAHGLLGLRWFDRHGHLLWWRPGRGFAFSDLSAHDKRSGFPHTYRYLLTNTAQGCQATLRVRGVWTDRRWPRWCVRVWLAWVMWQAGSALQLRLTVACLKAALQ